MNLALAHRGPDGDGVWVAENGRVGLGHRRLAINDLSSEAGQPMSNEDDTIWLSCNGEIYNYREVRKTLEKLGGHSWKTDHSDMEVILHAYEEWGVECIHRFRGMFAFALWDGRKRRLWLVRDRIGIKPLVYCLADGRLTFASEIKGLAALGGVRREIEEQALFDYFVFGFFPGKQTLHKDIVKLSPGTWLLVEEDGRIREERYWDVWSHAQPLTGMPPEAISERVLAELKESVALHDIGDVPSGILLSGGVDSSAVANIYSELRSDPIKVFTIGYHGENTSYPNEMVYAREMAGRIGADYHERILSPDDLMNAADDLVHFQEEPLGNPVCFPIYLLAQLARENGAVYVLGGEGADEIFFGYTWYKSALITEKRLRRVRPLLGALPMPRADAASVWQRSRDWAQVDRVRKGLPAFACSMGFFSEKKIQRLLSPDTTTRIRGYSSWDVIDPIYQRFVSSAWEKTPEQWFSYVDLCLRLPDMILSWIDKMTMATSLESRVPFLDHHLVELAFGIPGAIKADGVSKSVLKRAVRGIVPDSIIDRPKQGLWVPITEWFGRQLGGHMESEIKTFANSTGMLNYPEVIRMTEQKKYIQLWYLYGLCLWWKKYMD